MSLARGVYILDFVSDLGFPLAVAIRGDGTRLCEQEIFPIQTEEDVVEHLWDRLDREDPLVQEDAA